MGNALRKDVAVFHQVPAQSIDALGALPYQEIPSSEHDAVRLLLFGLDRNEAHARPLGRFTDRLCIGGIILLPLDERFDVGRRDQAHMMAQLSDLTRPVVRAGTGFHRHDAPACAARKLRSFARVTRLRKSTCPAPSAPCTWNTCFAMSKPIVVACSMDASFGGSSTPSPWHTDAVGGRPPHHPKPPFARAGISAYRAREEDSRSVCA